MISNHAFSCRDDRPRLVCRIVRRCAVFSERRPGHARSCPSCQSYFQTNDTLESTLRQAARSSRGDPFAPSPDFESSLLRAVRTSAPRGAPSWPEMRPHRAWALAGIGAAAVIAAIALMLPFNPPSTEFVRVASSSPADDAAVILETVESLSTEFMGSVVPSAGQLVATNPLQHELNAVYSDARSALHFLALNFLPTGRTEPAPEGARRG